MSIAAEFLAIKALRDEVRRGGQNEIWQLTTPEIRLALDKRYIDLAKFMLRKAFMDDAMMPKE